MEIKKISRNLHQINLELKKTKIALLSDIHWDNPKCDRNKLKRHLDYCKEQEIPIFINGDFFCLMQGKYDPRRSKKDILPEHNKANYIDAVIEDAVDYWSPYAHLLTVIGYGNHETAIIKNLETDPLQRFVDLLNYTNKTSVFTGGYGGWLVIKKQVEIKEEYKSAEKNLSVDKKTYDDLLAASVADVKYKDKDKNQVKADFKAAVEARNLLIDKRDALIDQINTATTIEEVEAIVW